MIVVINVQRVYEKNLFNSGNKGTSRKIYGTLGCFIKTKVVQSFSASILCDGCIYKDFRNILLKKIHQFLGVPQGGSTLKKVNFQNVVNSRLAVEKLKKNMFLKSLYIHPSHKILAEKL